MFVSFAIRAGSWVVPWSLQRIPPRAAPPACQDSFDVVNVGKSKQGLRQTMLRLDRSNSSTCLSCCTTSCNVRIARALALYRAVPVLDTPSTRAGRSLVSQLVICGTYSTGTCTNNIRINQFESCFSLQTILLQKNGRSRA